MRNKIYTITSLFVLLTLLSNCRKKGCMDDSATNYDSAAKKDDGSCVYEDPIEPQITLTFDHDYDGMPITASDFDQLSYSNQSGDVHSITHLEYLISGIRFYQSNGDSIVFNDYNLVDLVNTNTLTFGLSNYLEAGSYTGIGFNIGFDEASNTSGAYADLNVANWSWPEMLGGGYHFMKLEGKFIDNNTDTTSYAYHHGTAREIISADTTFHANHTLIKLNTAFTVEDNATITIDMNIAEWFKNPNTWDLNTYNSMLMPNYTAQRLMRGNAASVFSWSSIVQ